MLPLLFLTALASDSVPLAEPRLPASAMRSALVQGRHEQLLAEHTRANYDAHLRDEESAGEFLEGFQLRWEPGRGDAAGLPPEVFAAYSYYAREISHRDLGAVRAYRVPIAGLITYAIRVTTDGDDGWLELFGPDGESLGTARTYIEIVAWDDRGSVRAQTNNAGELPPALRDAPKRTHWGK